MNRILPSRRAFLFALAASVALLLFCDWRTEEVSFILAVLLALSATIGFFMPRFGWIGGAVTGGAIPIKHFVAVGSNWLAPAVRRQAPDAADLRAILILIAVGVMAGVVGAWVRARVETSI